ncbi:MAG: dTDP-glucose 4,6-dehydratase [Candidatus Peregrinibacteria bacterium Greene0416_19]|nr:MAG: dTDP-glucose 4,6-dehydratase [Candidatus Peregrinibacteria bacterium Greene0416_19]
MNLLVTGGAGFIGSHFVLRHKQRFPDDAIVVLDKLTYAGSKAFLDSVINRIRFAQGDITDVELTAQLIGRYGIDTIVNFAAETHVDRSIKNAVPFIHTNILGVQSLIEVCRAHPEVRLLHISSDEVYGDIADEDAPCKVGDPLFPSSPYAASKAAGEMLLLSAMRTYGIKCAITRCTNNFGPHQDDEKFIPTVIRHALKNEPVPVYGKGKNKRDWLYVTDHTDALELVLQTEWAFHDPAVPGVHPSQPRGSGHFFNISADDERENFEVAKAVLDILGKPHSLISFVEDRPGHDWRYALDSSAIRNLGWQPTVGFRQGLEKTVEWYRSRQ